MDLVFSVLGRIGAGFVSPVRRCWASVEVSHWPCLVMPMGITSYFVRSMALRMEAAERRETSCSPERPPKRMPTRNFFFAGFFVVCFLVMDSYKFLPLCGLDAEKSWEGYRGGFYRGFADFGVFCGGKSRCSCGGLRGKSWWVVWCFSGSRN